MKKFVRQEKTITGTCGSAVTTDLAMSLKSQRLQNIEIVMNERAEMVSVGQEILSLLGRYPYTSPEPDWIQVQRRLLEFMNHLSIIGGFCERNWQKAIFDIQAFLGLSTLSLNFDRSAAPSLASFMAMALMVQVDFTKTPFRLVGFDVKAYGARFKTILKR
ncbi:MAG: hypothetical protein AUF79_07875 [Crenarchaeota archaeon 13_1_20CM_2_51_8]|nr:MAG: hypothetical protein AUF79_07875 [Crenarchaeota archaeon 13_1_20CM_2_51_8]